MSETPTFDPSIQTENIAFDRQEMIACDGCGRLNPPNRLKCMYCAAELAISVKDAAGVMPIFRKLEIWERGYNLIVREKTLRTDAAAAARFLSIDRDNV